MAQHWPGNVRELANACAFAVRVSGARDWVEPRHWPSPPLVTDSDIGRGLHAETRALEERRLREALDRSHGNKSRAARSLGLSRQGLLKKLRRYGLRDEALAAEEFAGDDPPAADPAAEPFESVEDAVAGARGFR